jgi:hypothetical protein
MALYIVMVYDFSREDPEDAIKPVSLFYFPEPAKDEVTRLNNETYEKHYYIEEVDQ